MSVRPEERDVGEFLGRLKAMGWLDGSSIVGVGERELVPSFFKNLVRKAIRRINHGELSNLPGEDEELVLRDVLDKLDNDKEVEILHYLKHGVELYVSSWQRKITVMLIDYDKLENNVFFYLVRPRYRGSPTDIEPDIVLYVNGFPLVVVEAKKYIKPYSYEEAVEQIRRYEMFSRDVFRFIQFGVALGDEERVTPTWPNWSGEKRRVPSFRWIVRATNSDGRIEEVNDVSYILEPGRLLEYIRYFVFYRREKDGEIGKIIARYNQYYAARKAMRRIDEYMSGGSRNRGLIWHWLGSGKTYTMFFIANYFIEKYWRERPVVFFIVDRSDLEEQHERVLKGVINDRFTSLFKRIESIEELHDRIRVLKEGEYRDSTLTYGVYLTTIQKFQRGPRTPETREELEAEKDEIRRGLLDLLRTLGMEYLERLKEERPGEYEEHMERLEKLKGRERDEYLVELGRVKGRNILVLVDEAHRTQYGILAAMRKTVFPNALVFGFTGTPIFKHERNTFSEFGHPEVGEYYLDVYFIRESIRDGFTLPLVYHVVREGEVSSPGVRIRLSEDEIRGFIDEYMKGRRAGLDMIDHLDPTIHRKVGKYLNHVRLFLMNAERIDKLAKYIAERVEEDTEGFKYKAMVVAVNRLACVRFKRSLEKYLVEKYGEEARNWVEVVMTYNYNDREKEIISYREELAKKYGSSDMNEVNREIQRRFLEEENPRILIVTDMLITGFDAPILKVMYLDKPLYEHRLLQAIARVNRPYPGKELGLIVDSLGLLDHLSKTLALYNMLVDEKVRQDLKENLMENIDEKLEEFLRLYNSIKERLRRLVLGGEDASIDLETLRDKIASTSFNKKELDAKIGLIAVYASRNDPNDDVAKAKRLVNDMRMALRLYKALGSHPKKLFYVEDVEILAFIYAGIVKRMRRGVPSIGKEFWEDLVKFIRSKTLLDEFRKIGEARIDNETLDELLRPGASKLDLKRAVADYYFYLKAVLSSNPRDPIYKEIMKRLDKLVREWIEKKLTLKTLLAEMRALEEERRSYEERITGKPLEEKITEAVNAVIKSRLKSGVPPRLKLANTKREIRWLVEKKSRLKVSNKDIKDSDKRRLAGALLNDLFRSLGDRMSDVEIKRLADSLMSEFIADEVKRAIRA